MNTLEDFSVTESYNYRDLLDEAIECIRSAQVELSAKTLDPTCQPLSPAQQIVDLLENLKTSQAHFAQELTVQPLTAENSAAGGSNRNLASANGTNDHRFYLVRVPVLLMPAAGWAFVRLRVWIGFEPAAASPKVHDLYPEDVWTEIFRTHTSFKLGLDENLEFRAAWEAPSDLQPALSAEANAKLMAAGKSRLMFGPFDYHIVRPQVLARGREHAEAFWQLDGEDYVQREEPDLACVLRVPKDAPPLCARGKLIAYQRFDFWGSDLRDWAGQFRDKVISFFTSGLPLESVRAWQNIVM